MTSEMMTPADLAAVCNGGGGGRNNDGMFGGDGLWGLIIILALLGGFGNGDAGFEEAWGFRA